MSWHDPARSLEPEAETALRDELRGLLGMPGGATSYFETEATPELIALADDLRREAVRRNRTARKQHSWMLLAAALPFALALGAVTTWGVGQKRKADNLAAAVTTQQAEIQRMAAAQRMAPPAPSTPQLARTAPPAQPTQPSQSHPAPALLAGQSTPGIRPKELVIPVQRSAEPTVNNTQRVKAP